LVDPAHTQLRPDNASPSPTTNSESHSIRGEALYFPNSTQLKLIRMKWNGVNCVRPLLPAERKDAMPKECCKSGWHLLFRRWCLLFLAARWASESEGAAEASVCCSRWEC